MDQTTSNGTAAEVGFVGSSSASATIFLLLTVFHGPILRSVLHSVAVKVAAGENLKLDFRVEGSVLGGITLRNVHATPTGPSAVQSLDADLIRADYSLADLLFHGMSDFLKDIEVRNVTAVIDPSKAPLATPTPPPQNEKISLPAYFPDRLQVSNVNLTVRGDGQDTILRNLNLGLFPDKEGALRIAQVADPERARLEKHHRHHHLREEESFPEEPDLRRGPSFPDDQHRRFARRAGENWNCRCTGSVGEGTIEGNVGLSTTKSSYETTDKGKGGRNFVRATERILRATGGRAGGRGEEFRRWIGQGTLDAPQTWAGTITAQVDNVKQSGIALDHVGLDVVADKGTATVREARIDRGTNHMQLGGTVQLPKTTEGFRRTPGDLKLTINAPNLQELTAFMSPPVTGSLQANGTIKTDQSIARVELTAKGDLIGFDKAAVNNAEPRKFPRRRNCPRPDATEEAVLRESHFVDQRPVERRALRRIRGRQRPGGDQEQRRDGFARAGLGAAEGQFVSSSGELTSCLRLTERRWSSRRICSWPCARRRMADFWQERRAGQGDGRIAGRRQRADPRRGSRAARLNLSGREIAAQKLLVKQLSAQLAIAQNVVYLNDLTATLNEKDYVRANGTVKLQKPFRLQRRGDGEPGRSLNLRAAPRDGGKENAAGGFVSRELEWAWRDLDFQEHRRPHAQAGEGALRRAAKPPGQRRGALQLRRNCRCRSSISRATSSSLQTSVQAKERAARDQQSPDRSRARRNTPPPTPRFRFTGSDLGTRTASFFRRAERCRSISNRKISTSRSSSRISAPRPPVSGQLTVASSTPRGRSNSSRRISISNCRACARTRSNNWSRRR